MTRSDRRSLVYLGWQGNANFGDDLLHETWRAALDDPLDIVAPLNARDYLRGAASFARDRLRTRRAERVVLIGGGTTVGFAAWAEHARLAARNYGAAGIVGVGLGAAASSDTYALDRHQQDWKAWHDLDRLRIAGVRGPITELEVTTHLGPVTISGDPALLYPLVRSVQPAGAPGERRIGVSLGSDPTSRFDVEAVATAVDAHARATGADQVVAFALSVPDQSVARALSERLRTPSVVHEYTDVAETMSVIAGCDLVVSERLHGAVAAVSLDVPTVPLSYASKCDDFWASLTGHPAPITVGHTADDLVRAMRQADTVRSAITGAVFAQQERLEGIRRELSEWRRGARSTTALLDPSGASA
ncbi:polysaccharide pyruvyl transferase family protein [Curtobacterium sp. MCJR17_020]|uniref:polysaccharide pyruvyl transferase family protein n=1 Tax=Curtobacterium sp. MCJR17_020 TaxID=2175619 RepID=UPI000DA9F00D|nr:polysaccharide pyruvyl transferase family protein [Curtobacterium sp. MCJR17_020]WIE72645.1 polysaccharide pyruvyl transferase family protein [Curtobacterium sp. MCJR17_020]